MITAALVEFRAYVRNPQLVVVLIALPLTLVATLSSALSPIYPGDNPYQATIPGFAVMFGFFGMAFAADGYFRERVWGNWPRLLSLPIDRWRLMIGKALAPIFVVSLQLVVMLGFGALFFDVRLGSPLALAVLIPITAAAGCAPGLLLACVVRSHVELDQFANLLVIGLGAAGGAVVPVDRLPDALSWLAPLTPQFWALQGFERVMSDGVGLGGVSVPLMVLAATAAVVHVVGRTMFRVERMVEPI